MRRRGNSTRAAPNCLRLAVRATHSDRSHYLVRSTLLASGDRASCTFGTDRGEGRDYTAKLVDRMSILRFPDADPLKLSAFRARDAVENLYQVASELERKAKLPKWAGGQMPQESKPRDRWARQV